MTIDLKETTSSVEDANAAKKPRVCKEFNPEEWYEITDGILTMHQASRLLLTIAAAAGSSHVLNSITVNDHSLSLALSGVAKLLDQSREAVNKVAGAPPYIRLLQDNFTHEHANDIKERQTHVDALKTFDLKF